MSQDMERVTRVCDLFRELREKEVKKRDWEERLSLEFRVDGNRSVAGKSDVEGIRPATDRTIFRVRLL